MPDESRPLTANRLIGYNLARIRKALGLSQEEAAERLAPYLPGKRWSKTVYSAAERSYDGGRVRNFDGDELLALSLAFGVPVTYFLLPPRPEDEGGRELRSGKASVTWPALFEALLDGKNRMAFAQRAFERPRGERVNVDSYLTSIVSTPRSMEEYRDLRARSEAAFAAEDRDGA
jgi:transcriptional regulator with XRE-family HTH domain